MSESKQEQVRRVANKCLASIEDVRRAAQGKPKPRPDIDMDDAAAWLGGMFNGKGK